LSKGMTEEQRSDAIETLAFLLKNTIDAVDDLKSNS